MNKRANDIQALLGHARTMLPKIESSYTQSLHKTEIDANLSVEIKNFCENLRSALDYLARDVRETYCPSANTKDRFYFPILGDKAQFASQVEKWYPGLQSAKPELWAYLESIQPFASGDNSWLGVFNRLNNENKHGALVPQTRSEWEEVRVTSKAGSVRWSRSGVRFGPGVYISGVPIDPRTQLPVPHPSQRVERIKWVDFRFQDLNVSAIALLQRSLAGVEAIIAAASKLL